MDNITKTKAYIVQHVMDGWYLHSVSPLDWVSNIENALLFSEVRLKEFYSKHKEDYFNTLTVKIKVV
jgi:hypothetical protein